MNGRSAWADVLVLALPHALGLEGHFFLHLLCLICKRDLLGLWELNETVWVRGLCLLEGPKETVHRNNQNFKLKYSSVFLFSPLEPTICHYYIWKRWSGSEVPKVLFLLWVKSENNWATLVHCGPNIQGRQTGLWCQWPLLRPFELMMFTANCSDWGSHSHPYGQDSCGHFSLMCKILA